MPTKNISIKLIKNIPIIRHTITHEPNGEMIVLRKKKEEWKNHNIRRISVHVGWWHYTTFINFDQWNVEEYQKQWKSGISRLNNEITSCLVTNVHLVRNMMSIEWWLFYKIDNFIYAQQDFVLGSSYNKLIGKKKFTPDTCYDFIPPRKTHYKDEKIPEIVIPIKYTSPH